MIMNDDKQKNQDSPGVVCHIKGVRITPRKLSVVASLVRNRTVADAVEILSHTPRRAALPIKKAIDSAVANADYNHGYKTDTLFISKITVTPGTRYKRWQPAARGRALPYQLKTSHIRVIVDGDKRASKQTQKPGKQTSNSEKGAK